MPYTTDRPPAGTWVQVWGQVADYDDHRVHPDDVPVMFRSHNEDTVVAIHHDGKRLEAMPMCPSWADRCDHLFRTKSGTLHQCTLWDQHGPDRNHTSGKHTWIDDQTHGYLEERA